MKYFRKDWILYQEIANEGGNHPEFFKAINEQTGDMESNKHIPFIEEVNDGYKVKIGKNGYHDMNHDHHLLFIELIVDDMFHKILLKHDSKPEVYFKVEKGLKVSAMTFCNLHGLFKNIL